MHIHKSFNGLSLFRTKSISIFRFPMKTQIQMRLFDYLSIAHKTKIKYKMLYWVENKPAANSVHEWWRHRRLILGHWHIFRAFCRLQKRFVFRWFAVVVVIATVTSSKNHPPYAFAAHSIDSVSHSCVSGFGPIGRRALYCQHQHRKHKYK